MYASASSGIARPFSRSKSTFFGFEQWETYRWSNVTAFGSFSDRRFGCWLYWWLLRYFGEISDGSTSPEYLSVPSFCVSCLIINLKKTPNEAPKYFHSFAGAGEVPRSYARECSRISSVKMVTDLFDSLMCPSNRNESSKPSALGPVFSSGWIRANSSSSHSL